MNFNLQHTKYLVSGETSMQMPEKSVHFSPYLLPQLYE